MRGQVSLEYLFIVGLALAIIIPGAFLFYQYSKTSNDQLVSADIVRAGNEVIHVGEETYVTGIHSWRTVKATFPEQVSSMEFVGNRPNQELVIKYWTDAGSTDAVFFVPSSLEFRTMQSTIDGDGLTHYTVNVSSGLNTLRIEAKEDVNSVYLLVTT